MLLHKTAKELLSMTRHLPPLTHLERGRSPRTPPPVGVEGLLDGQLSQDVSVDEHERWGPSREERVWGTVGAVKSEREGLNCPPAARCS